MQWQNTNNISKNKQNVFGKSLRLLMESNSLQLSINTITGQMLKVILPRIPFKMVIRSNKEVIIWREIQR